MQLERIVDSVYWTGILNPNLRIFDIVVRTDYGTSYNSYIVIGKEKTALIEVCDEQYIPQLLSNIKAITGETKLDYIIMNHNEPDHSGGLDKLLDATPGAKIVVSKAGSVYLKNITNRTDIDVMIAKDGDKIDLGGKTLSIISAPFLHWPDSMFTYLEEEKVLFSCDFLGTHYCEPYVLDKNIIYKDYFFDALKVYYDAIFKPFGKHVRNGLQKMEGLDIDYVCTSHGPIITKECYLDEVLKLYTEWSKDDKDAKKLVPIFYVSAYGNTGKIAKCIAQGVRETLPDAQVETFDIIHHDMKKLYALINDCDAFAIGSPTLNRDSLPPIWDLLSHVDVINSLKKPTLAFGSFGWSGEAVPNIISRLKCLKTSVFGEGFKVCFVPTEEDLKKAKELGKEFAATIK